MDVVDFKDLGQYEGWTVDGIFTTVALTKPPAQGHPPLEG
jgi:hypothetical protein